MTAKPLTAATVKMNFLLHDPTRSVLQYPLPLRLHLASSLSILDGDDSSAIWLKPNLSMEKLDRRADASAYNG
jgi:hypothetical protein